MEPALPDHAGQEPSATSGPAADPVLTPSKLEDANSISTPTGRLPSAAGFTLEEELFRARWGWAAHDAVRRAALNFDSPPP